MKVLMINVVCGIRSTGRICTDLATALEKQGHDVKIAYGRESVPEKYKHFAVKIGNDLGVKLHALKARLFDSSGFGSKLATKKFIRWVKEYDPDVIHLHNLHGYYINIEILFNYLRTCGKKVIWTLHDCWAFTGHCVYFDYVGCDKWKSQCGNCPQKNEYPSSLIWDRSKQNYIRKKALFTDIPDMTVVTPSEWLAGLVKKSYMAKYHVEVVHNGVDTNIFKPTKSDLRERYSLQNKKIILGVAAIWDKRKWLDSFIELSKKLDESYQIVLVGLSADQIKELPENITGIVKTNSPEQLAAIYTMADLFINPTLEDNYPTTNLEARACGTPVITYDTGGSVESADVVVKKGDIPGLVEVIKSIFLIDFKQISLESGNTVERYAALYEKE